MNGRLRLILTLLILLSGQFRSLLQDQTPLDLLFVRGESGHQHLILSSSDGQEVIDLTGNQRGSDLPA